MKIVLFLFVFILYSCTNTNHKKDVATIIESDQRIKIDIDNKTNFYTNTLLYYQDKSTKEEYIVIDNSRNPINHTINFYSINTGQLTNSIPIYHDGRTEIEGTEGFAVLSLDSIVVSDKNVLKFFIINKTGDVIKVIDHSKDDNGMYVLSSPPESFINTPFVLIDGKIYCQQFIPLTRWIGDNMYGNNFEFSECPICATLDTSSNELIYLSAKYPNLYEKDENVHSEYCSRIYGNGKFVYGYLNQDSIYVTNKEHKSLIPYYAGSRYQKGIKNEGYPRTLSMEQALIWEFSTPTYGNLIYDEFENVYYRFVHFASNDIKKNEPSEIYSCRKAFSIIIFDEKFNIIGETQFPSGRYAPMLFFVNKDGLWLSENNYERTDMTEDKLVFRCLKLQKQ